MADQAAQAEAATDTQAAADQKAAKANGTGSGAGSSSAAVPVRTSEATLTINVALPDKRIMADLSTADATTIAQQIMAKAGAIITREVIDQLKFAKGMS